MGVSSSQLPPIDDSDDGKTETKEERKRRKELKNQIEYFFICVESGSATQVQEILRKHPFLINEKPPPTLPNLSVNQVGHLHPIHISVQKAHYGVTKVLLEADPRCANAYREPVLPWDYSSYGEYPIQSLLAGGYSMDNQNANDILTLLLEAKADVNCTGCKLKSPPLLIALKYGNLKWAKKLLDYQADITVTSKADVDANSIGVFQAATTYSGYAEGMNEFISYLIERGIDINATFPNTAEPPLINSVRIQNYKLATAIMKNKADVNVRNTSNQNALDVCVASGANEQIFTELLNAGASIYEVDIWGNTLLHTLASSYYVNSNIAILKTVIKLGLNYDRKNSNNLTAVEIALNHNHREILKVFMENQIGIEFWNPSNNHPLLLRLVQNRWENEVDLLYKMGMDFNIHSPILNNHTALHVAIQSRFDVQKLLSYGSDPNAQDFNGDTPLHYAITLNAQAQVVETLLNAGSDVNLKNNAGNTPKTLTVMNTSNHQVKKLLESAC